MKDLKNKIICPNCESVNIKKPLKRGEAAYCYKCGKVLYKDIRFFEYKLFGFAISLLIFFIVAMFLPVISINIIGYEEKLQIIKATLFLFNQGYVFISFFVLITVVVFPFVCFVVFFMLSVLFITKYNKELAKKLLIFITAIKKWCFFDIFFIAIMVAVIKMFSYASIDFEGGFIAFICFLTISFIIKYYGIEGLWEIWENM